MALGASTVFVDWGTTNFRAYLVAGDRSVVDAVSSDQGVKSSSGRFEEVLSGQIRPWLEEHDVSSIVCAGMIGGDLGWRNVSMTRCPATVQDVAERLCPLTVRGLPDILIIPGVYCDATTGVIGMMRGEEVLLFGSLLLRGCDEGRFCFPGTHSKWVTVYGGAIQTIETCMTGECFALFRTASVLSRSLEGWSGEISEPAFRDGLRAARSTPNPLQSAFSVRALHIQGRLESAEARASYLSGLLIGAEVAGFASVAAVEKRSVVVVCEPRLAHLYETACGFFDVAVALLDERECFVAGGAEILRRHGALTAAGGRAALSAAGVKS